MRKKRGTRILALVITLLSLGSIVFGFYQKDESPKLGHRYIGLGTAGLFLVAMPLFLFTESSGKKMEDYMLTKENIDKMREKSKKK